jgi:hypothetical protein
MILYLPPQHAAASRGPHLSSSHKNKLFLYICTLRWALIRLEPNVSSYLFLKVKAKGGAKRSGRGVALLKNQKKYVVGTRYVAFVFLPGGLLIYSKQGLRGARIRGAPLPHSHNALVVTSWSQEGQVGNQETPHNTEGVPMFSRGAVRASWSPLS